MNITTRPGTRDDIPAVFELVKELAVYEKALDQVSNSIERMEKDYDDKLYDFHVAESDGVIVGLALY
ncbi:N-acetyltransferase family protein, partial [Persicitalea sp.]|uniref:GNAT family N-acetyltransferase n=1 Tax=Persicitalea sp. TaxID=3100273 RepID=UPI003593BAEA